MDYDPSSAFATAIDFSCPQGRALIAAYEQLAPEVTAANSTLPVSRLTRLISGTAPGPWNASILAAAQASRRLPTSLRGRAVERIPDARSAAGYLATQPATHEDIEVLLGRFLDGMTGEDIDRIWQGVPRVPVIGSAMSSAFYQALGRREVDGTEIAVSQLTYLAMTGPGELGDDARELSEVLEVLACDNNISQLTRRAVPRALAYLVEHRPDLVDTLVRVANELVDPKVEHRALSQTISGILLASRRLTNPDHQFSLLSGLLDSSKWQPTGTARSIRIALRSPLIHPDVAVAALGATTRYISRTGTTSQIREAWQRAGVMPTGLEVGGYSYAIAEPWIEHLSFYDGPPRPYVSHLLSLGYLIEALRHSERVGDEPHARDAAALRFARDELEQARTRTRRAVRVWLRTWHENTPDPLAACEKPSCLCPSEDPGIGVCDGGIDSSSDLNGCHCQILVLCPGWCGSVTGGGPDAGGPTRCDGG